MADALQFHHVSKTYQIGGFSGSLRALFSAWRPGGKQVQRTFNAVNDISFTVADGESVGLIGHNGAGKTTMLKLISQVTYPTTGSISVRGRLSALIQLGAGFHPDLSGRDNIYLNGTILGLSRAEIKRIFDEIVAFSELEQFLDTPVKRYSSGMYARLGFAVAVHVMPEVLLVDEVLSVGDAAFQYKCFRKIRELVNSGRTVIFVSHNLDAVQSLCQRVIWLDHGTVRYDDRPAVVIDAYLNQQEQRFLQAETKLSRDVQSPLHITKVILRDRQGQAVTEFASGEPLTVEMHYEARETITAPNFTLGISDQGAGMLFLATMLLDKWERQDLSGTGVVTCAFDQLPLMPKAYQVWGEVRDQRGFVYLVNWQPFGTFRITAPPPQLQQPEASADMSVSHLRNDAPIYVPHSWDVAQN